MRIYRNPSSLFVCYSCSFKLKIDHTMDQFAEKLELFAEQDFECFLFLIEKLVTQIVYLLFVSAGLLSVVARPDSYKVSLDRLLIWVELKQLPEAMKDVGALFV